MSETTVIQSKKSRHNGMFKPGMSGNPSGRPKSDVTIKELAKSHTQEALATLVDVMSNPKATPSARVQAATAILDRGWGKPTQSIETVNMNVTYEDFLDRLALDVEADVVSN